MTSWIGSEMSGYPVFHSDKDKKATFASCTQKRMVNPTSAVHCKVFNCIVFIKV